MLAEHQSHEMEKELRRFEHPTTSFYRDRNGVFTHRQAMYAAANRLGTVFTVPLYTTR
jgi:hypothetical protein